MMGKRLLALMAAAGVFGLSPVFASEDADAVSFETKPYTERIVAVEEETVNAMHVAASDDTGLEVASNSDISDASSE